MSTDDRRGDMPSCTGSSCGLREGTRSHAAQPVSRALRDGLRRYVAKRVRPENVDDVVQDILLRMHERAAELRDEQKLAGWAFRIAKSVVTDHHRRASGPTKVTFGAPDELASSERVEPSDDENQNEMVAGWLLPMVALLPDEYAEALEVCDLGGMEQRVYAERKGLSISGAKSRVQRGRRMLEELVRACCDLEQDVRGNVIGITHRGQP